MDKPEYEDRFPEGPYKTERKVQDHISEKALRDLPKSSYSIKADPYTASLPVSTPYNILSRFLKTVGGQYKGQDNLDGGNVKQYANSVLSKFLNAFDSMRMRLGINYRFLPIAENSIRGKYLVDEMRKSIAEAISVLQSTTFTNLAINNYVLETDMNMGSATTTTIDGKQVYTDITDVVYGTAVYYQIFLQEALSVMNFHNSFRLKQGTAIRDGWSREVPLINSFFGLMNKSAFLNLLDSINLSFEGEYVDTDFMSQINILSLMPSRKANDLVDPVLEIETFMIHPSKFKLYQLNGEELELVFDDAELVSGDGVSFWQACADIKDNLSLFATKAWAREIFKPGVVSALTESGTARYNAIKENFDVIINAFTYFKPCFADFRECLDTMTRTGTLSWTKHFRPSVVKDTDAELYQNLIVDDIFKMVMSGADEAAFNKITKRWATFSMWNIYTGIPQYDAKQGGAFITLSTKEYSYDVEDADQIQYVPTMFKYLKDSNNAIVYAVSRKGRVVGLDYEAVVMNNVSVLSRLVPISSQNNLKLRVPSVSYIKPFTDEQGHVIPGSDVLDDAENSFVYYLLTKIFGVCKVTKTVGAVTVADYSLDPDLLAIYQTEIEDVTNIAITYARANAPFRGTTSTEGLIGFAAITSEK